ncbi:hypothetical protein D3C71_1873340 [compost metagenome]
MRLHLGAAFQRLVLAGFLPEQLARDQLLLDHLARLRRVWQASRLCCLDDGGAGDRHAIDRCGVANMEAERQNDAGSEAGENRLHGLGS